MIAATSPVAGDPVRIRRWPVALIGVIVAAIYLANVSSFLSQTNDDAFITFRYSKFLANGLGPYFNRGQHVEGYTNFLMMPLMAGVIRIAGDDAVLPVAKAIGVTAGLFSILGAWMLCRSWLRRVESLSACATSPLPHGRGSDSGVIAWGAGALVAVNSAFALNSTTGLETTMLSAFITFGLLLACGDDEGSSQASGLCHRAHAAGVLFALAALTRPEGALIFAVVVFINFAAGRSVPHPSLREGRGTPRTSFRALLIQIAWVSSAVAGLLVFRWFYYDGELLPNTYFAKSGGMVGRTAGGYLVGFAQRHLGGWLFFLAALPLPLWYWSSSRSDEATKGPSDEGAGAPSFSAEKGGGRTDRRETYDTLVRSQPHAARRTGHPARTEVRGSLPLLPATSVMILAVCATFFTGPDWMPGYRLLVPYLPIWSALVVCGVALLVGRNRSSYTARTEVGEERHEGTEARRHEGEGGRDGGRQARGNSLTAVAVIAVVVFLALWQIPIRRQYVADCLARSEGYREGHLALARWLCSTEDGADNADGATMVRTVALMDIGIVGFECFEWNVLDTTGLTDRTIAKSAGPFLAKEFDPAYVFDQQPEFLVIIMGAPLRPDGSDDIENLSPWTPIEERLVATEAFAQHYYHPRPAPPGDDELTRMAALLGAERVFRHTYPGHTYLLAVYQTEPRP